MPDEERVEDRHPMRSSEADRADAVEILKEGAAESGLGRRPLIRNTLVGALALAPLPAVVFLRDLGPMPANEPGHHHLEGGAAAGPRPRGPREPRGRRGQGVRPHHRLGRARDARGHREGHRRARGAGQGRRPADAARPGPRWTRPRRPGATRGSSPTPRSAPTWAARSPCTSSDAPPALPVPPVDLRRHAELQGDLRPGQAAASAACRLPWTARDTWSPRADSTRPVGPSFWERG